MTDKSLIKKKDYYDFRTDVWTGNQYKGLYGKLVLHGHIKLENQFSKTDHFGKVLEVGCGSAEHINHIKHSYNEYHMTDSNEMYTTKLRENLSENFRKKTIIATENACKLSYDDNTFDRLIATHVMEHLPFPHEVFDEWSRLLKPGGVMSILLPCDPGVLWRFGRMIRPGRKNSYSEDYYYHMALENINPINNLVAILRKKGGRMKEYWWPMHVASIDLNLFYYCHIYNN